MACPRARHGGRLALLFFPCRHLHAPGVTYSTPLHVRVLPDYPVSAPVVFLVPTPDMAIVRQHKNVDEQGRCYLPYLTSWNPASSSLAGLVTVMSEVRIVGCDFNFLSDLRPQGVFGGSSVVQQAQAVAGNAAAE
jgi:hypothetical protein